MPNVTLSLSRKPDRRGLHTIIARIDFTRKNRPQFRTGVKIAPEYFEDGEIKIPTSGKNKIKIHNEIIAIKNQLDSYLAMINAIAMALPEESISRKSILEIYEDVKTINPADINRTTILTKRREEITKNTELVKSLIVKRELGVLEYMRVRLKKMEKGEIKRKGNDFSKGTLKLYRESVRAFERFIKKRMVDWKDINEEFLDKYVQFHENNGYMKGTINKHLATLAVMIKAAFKEGYPIKASILDSFPKKTLTRTDKVEEIYLTEEEVQALYEMKLAGRDDNVRDIFLVGCYTSQRYSDYSRIRRDNVSKHNGVTIINIIQQKTKTEVSIPVLNDNLLKILEKHNYDLPNIDNVHLNGRLKVIMKKLSEDVPSLKEEIPTKLRLQQRKLEEDGKVKPYRRNRQGEHMIPKYDLVTTHTARRTGITLMYKSHILDTHEMMSISGHKTEKIFNEYIKVSGIELATGIAKKVAKAKSRTDSKEVILEKLSLLSVEQLAKILESQQ